MILSTDDLDVSDIQPSMRHFVFSIVQLLDTLAL